MKRFNLLKKVASIFMLSVLGLMIFNPLVSSAKYNKDLNGYVDGSLVIDTSGVVSFDIRYQYMVTDVSLYICKASINSAETCKTSATSRYADLKDITKPDGEHISSSLNTFEKPAIYNFISNTNNSKLVQSSQYDDITEYGPHYNGEDNPNLTYKVLIEAKFCRMPKGDLKECVWDSQEMTEEDKKPERIFFNKVNFTHGVTKDAHINKTLDDMKYIFGDIVIPVLWGVMGIILVVRGIWLSIDIVKASDDPETRSKKVRGLVWLFIGVGIAVAISTITYGFIKGF